jgi:glycosyltransferase involved in cell wall biosynthesis
MGICLNMIVRNEAANLPALFASLEGQADFFVISDTGSTDNTTTLIHELSAKHQIPGIVTCHDWSDFATNRNLALQDAMESKQRGWHQCERLLILDADEELSVRQQEWKLAMQPGVSYTTIVRGQRLSASRLSLLWMEGVDWHWYGNVHNHLKASGPTLDTQHHDGVFIRSHPFRGAKSSGFSSGTEKAAHDASVMSTELLGVPITQDNAYRFFQWAHVSFLSGSLQQAVDVFSLLALDARLDKELRYAAAVLAGRCSLAFWQASDQGGQWFEMAGSICPDRREALYYKALMIAPNHPSEAAELLCRASMLPVPAGNLFYLEHELYEWRLAYQQVIWAFAKGDWTAVSRTAALLLESNQVPEPERGFLAAMSRQMDPRKMASSQVAGSIECLPGRTNFPMTQPPVQ